MPNRSSAAAVMVAGGTRRGGGGGGGGGRGGGRRPASTMSLASNPHISAPAGFIPVNIDFPPCEEQGLPTGWHAYDYVL